MSHTPEPWRVSGTGHICAGDKVIPYDDLKADAGRIVACVNACVGLDTGLLEAVAATGGLAEQITGLRTTEQQRDELLAALVLMHDAFRYTSHDKIEDEANDAARAAIAKAKGA